MKQDWEIYRDTGILGAYRPEQVILRRSEDGGVGDILPDAALGDTGRDLDGLCLADFFAVGPVAVADGDLISPLVQLLDACHF